MKNTGTAYWACRSCTAYAKGLNHRMREIETELGQVKASCSKNEDGLKKIQEDVSKLAETVAQQTKKVDEAAGGSADSILEELRERELKKLNVIMHGMGEADHLRTGRERYDWDIASCSNLFKALNLGLDEKSVKFCRRLGESTPEHPRPLVVGFYNEWDKSRLLRADTRRTRFSNIQIGPDLTKKQRQEEANLTTEAVRRNRALGDDDRAKNLAWTVVGHRGEKRLVKKFINPDMERPRTATRPVAEHSTRRSLLGGHRRSEHTLERSAALDAARSLAVATTNSSQADVDEVMGEVEEDVERTQEPRPTRLGSKRKGGPMEEDLPPAKH